MVRGNPGVSKRGNNTDLGFRFGVWVSHFETLHLVSQFGRLFIMFLRRARRHTYAHNAQVHKRTCVQGLSPACAAAGRGSQQPCRTRAHTRVACAARASACTRTLTACTRTLTRHLINSRLHLLLQLLNLVPQTVALTFTQTHPQSPCNSRLAPPRTPRARARAPACFPQHPPTLSGGGEQGAYASPGRGYEKGCRVARPLSQLGCTACVSFLALCRRRACPLQSGE